MRRSPTLARALFLCLIVLGSSGLGSQEPTAEGLDPSFAGLVVPPPSVDARAIALIDAATGELLYAKSPELALPPASLTKLVTLHVIYNQIAAGLLSKDELVEIDKRDCSPYVPRGSALMYLRPGMRVRLIDLMLGAAVVSGNDAAFALARLSAGSNDAFARNMNKAVQELGFPDLYFVEPSGLSELNQITALGFARFCRRYLELHSESLAELHSVRHIEFPRPEHAVPGYTPEGKIIQYNRNDLVLGYPGCDGLKTGFIFEVGYNLALTAEREGCRFIVVTLGGVEGPQRRSRDGAALLDWAFDSFVTMSPRVRAVDAPRVWYGKETKASLAPSGYLGITLPRAMAPKLQVRVNVERSVLAPLAKGARLGEVIYSVDGRVLRRVDLVAQEDIGKGNVFVVILDAIHRFFLRLFGKL